MLQTQWTPLLAIVDYPGAVTGLLLLLLLVVSLLLLLLLLWSSTHPLSSECVFQLKYVASVAVTTSTVEFINI